MTRPNGHSDNGNAALVQEPSENEFLSSVPLPPLAPVAVPEFATRAKQRAKQQIQQNRFVIIGAGAVVTALLIFVAISMPHRGGPEKTKSRGAITNESRRGKPATKATTRACSRSPIPGALQRKKRTTDFSMNETCSDGNSFGLECFADRADEQSGNTGFDTAFWRPGMAGAALPVRLEC